MTVLPLLWLGSKNQTFFIYLPLFTQARLTKHAAFLFRNALLHPHSFTRIYTSGSQGFPTVLSEHFYLTSRVLIALRRVTSMKVTWEFAGLGFCLAFMFPVQGFEETALHFLSYGW